MRNLPWEPCPRCHEKNVEVVSNSDRAGARVSTWFFVIVLSAFVLFIASEPARFGMVLPAILLFGGLGVVVVAVIAAIIGGIASAGIKGYDAKCKVCSYQWEITEERAKELQAQTPAR